MILRDRVTFTKDVPVLDANGNPTYDDYGAEITQEVQIEYPAEVRGLGTEAWSDQPINGPITTRYRLFLPARASGQGHNVLDEVDWHGKTLRIESRLEDHRLGGRLHHVECIVYEQ